MQEVKDHHKEAASGHIDPGVPTSEGGYSVLQAVTVHIFS